MTDRTYYHDINGKQVPDEESMAAYLLDESILFLSEATDTEGKKTLALFININDYFVPASDAEPVTYLELPILFDLYKKKGYDGISEFVANKRGIPNINWRTEGSEFQNHLKKIKNI